MKFVQPKIIVSKCLDFESCRYNGQMIPDSFISLLKEHVDFIPVCPEVAIGLGTPREPIRLIEKDGVRQLVQPATGLDVTEKMRTFVHEFLAKVTNKNGELDADGFILKSQSPTCGLGSVKLYSGMHEKQEFDRTRGMFVELIHEKFPFVIIEDEGRMKNYVLREFFLTRVYAFARLREAIAQQSISALIDFHSQYKYILLTFDQQLQKEMGRLLASYNKENLAEITEEYKKLLHEVFAHQPKKRVMQNTLQHILGHFSDLSSEEKQYFLTQVDLYLDDKLPLSSLLTLIHAWAIRFDNEYIEGQAFLAPYPNDLLSVRDSGKGRI